MRGNEDHDKVTAAAEALKFPIPMRGNEATVRARSWLVSTVSDPHEG